MPGRFSPGRDIPGRQNLGKILPGIVIGSFPRKDPVRKSGHFSGIPVGARILGSPGFLFYWVPSLELSFLFVK